jgi:type II secretion system protein C
MFTRLTTSLRTLVADLQSLPIDHPADVLDALAARPEWARNGVRAAAFALVLLTAYQAAGLVWAVATPAPNVVPVAAAPAAVPPPAAYASLAQSAVFGRSTDLAAEALPLEHVTAETTLNLRLLGTIAGDGASRAFLLDQATNTRKTVAEGGTVADGVTLKAVARKKVILDNNGTLETLRMAGLPTPRVKRVAAPSQNLHIADASYVPLHQQAVTRRLQVTVREADTKAALSNLGTLTSQARFIPRIGGDNKKEGFVVMELQNNSFLRKLSLEEGDILLKLDGIPLVERERILPMLYSLQQQKSAVLTLARNGDIVDLVVKVE